MWTVYVRAGDHELIDIVHGISIRQLLEIIEKCVMTDDVEMVEVLYNNEAYTVYVRR